MKVIGLLILFSIAAFYIGYRVGVHNPKSNEKSKLGNVEKSNKLEFENQSTLEVLAVQQEYSSEVKQNQNIESEKHITSANQSLVDSTSDYEKAAVALHESGQESKENYQARKDFEDNFEEQNRDWQAQTLLTDYLQLHENGDQITLYKVNCETQKCQLIGEFDGDHHVWENMVNRLDKQDWWQYKGTSSSTTTKNGKTYFNLYLTK